MRRWLWWWVDDGVSEQWRAEYERYEQTRGIDGVAWRWPVKKLLDENSLWNRAQQQKRRA